MLITSATRIIYDSYHYYMIVQTKGETNVIPFFII